MKTAPRSDTGLTMVELLICISILAFTLGGVIAIFFAGSRQGQFAQQRTEAGRVAQAVFDFADMPKDKTILNWGRVRTAPYDPGDQIVVNGSITNLTPGATDIVKVELDLVWNADITDHVVDGLAMHILIITVAVDEDGNDMVDANDIEIARYYALMANR